MKIETLIEIPKNLIQHMKNEVRISPPDSLIRHRNAVIRNALMEEFRFAPEVEEAITKYRNNGLIFQRARAEAERLYHTNQEQIEALVLEKDSIKKDTGFSLDKMRQKDWNWLFRTMELEKNAEGMMYIWQNAPDGEFNKSISVRERLAMGLLYRAWDLYELGEQQSALLMLDEGTDIVNKLQAEGDQNSRLDKYWGYNHLFWASVYKNNNWRYEWKKTMEKSIEHLEQGFSKDFDTNTGLKLVKTKMQYAIEIGNEDELDDAFNIGKVVEMCAHRDGGRWKSNHNNEKLKKDVFKTLLNLLEISFLNGKDFEHISTIYRRLMIYTHGADNIHLENKLKEIQRIFSRIGKDNRKYFKRVQNGIKQLDILLNHQNNLLAKSGKKASYQLLERDSQQIFDEGIQFKFPFPIWISGNNKTAGITAPMMVGEADMEYVRSKLSQWGLNKSDDFRFVDQTLDKKIIEQFEGENQKTIGSEELNRYAVRMKNLMKITDSEKDWDATTNISEFFELGIGDCKPISGVYQYFRDVWWKDRINYHLLNAMNSRGMEDKFGANLKKAKRLLKRQSVWLNFIGLSRLKLDENGKPIFDKETGCYIKAKGGPVIVEKHSMPVEVFMDDNFVIRKVYFNDPLGHVHRLDGSKLGYLSRAYLPNQIVEGRIKVGMLDVLSGRNRKKGKTLLEYYLDTELSKNIEIKPGMTDFGPRYVAGIPETGIK